MKSVVLSIICLFAVSCASAQENATIVKTYSVRSSRQGIAVAKEYFYVINNDNISKHLFSDATLVAKWKENEGILQHMNSGRVINDTLFVCNSNYPNVPMASSIEMFDTDLNHIGSYSLGISNGSATWFDRYNGCNYVVFAHYNERGSELEKSNAWTKMVKYTLDWTEKESWVFPEDILERFDGRSNSGGRILPNGHIIATGHDNYEVYELKFPSRGFTLQYVQKH